MAKRIVVLSFIVAFICAVSGLTLRDTTLEDEEGQDQPDDVLFQKTAPEIDPYLITNPRSQTQWGNGDEKLRPANHNGLAGSGRRQINEFLFKLTRIKRAPSPPGSHEDSHEEDNSHETNSSAEHAGRSHSFHSHLLDFILGQVKKGHVTSALMTHWMTSITSALAHGSISKTEFDKFNHELAHLQGASGQDHDSNTCCWFG